MSDVQRAGRMLTKRTKALYDLGFAIHLLKTKSKAPIEDAWTKGPRKKWGELESNYRRGMNLGVRLGEVSPIGKGYLSVIDCDVKSTKSDARDELAERLKELFGDELDSAPCALSGRGNGSRHVYVVTKEPVSSRRLAQSSNKVKVHMPSAKKPSAYELEHLTAAEIKKGTRIRAAWEISLMGTGQQVVLPPSVHPDSGKEYAWEIEPTAARDFPAINPPKGKARKDEEVSTEGFEAIDVDLVSAPLDDKTVGEIVDGEGVEDRSAALLGVCNKMVRARMSDDEILSVLTEPSYYLGQVAYEHAQTSKRKVAARWLARYTLPKAKADSSHKQFYEDAVEEGPSKAEIRKAEKEEEWKDAIERTSPDSGNRPKPSFKNVLTILTGECGEGVFKKNEFAGVEIYGCDTPWGGREGREIKDIDPTRIRVWLTHAYKFEPHLNLVHEAISAIADQNAFHPVKDYLDTLKWDGTERVNRWLKTYLGAKGPEPYLSAVSRKVLVALIKRVYEPGCKFDHVLILEGNQGVGKSTALRNLVGDEWFTDAKINVQDKDAVMTIKAKWLIELGELSALRSADVEDLKAFISRTSDRIRVPYGRRAEEFPRQCVFIGSTNRDEYLKDPTGNRRYWPVKVGACDFESVTRDRDQLLAEAKFLYESCGEVLYLEESEMTTAAIKEQEKRNEHDPWDDLFEKWLGGKGAKLDSGFSMEELFEEGGPFADWRCDMREAKRAATILKKRSYIRKRFRRPDPELFERGVRGWYWVKKDD